MLYNIASGTHNTLGDHTVHAQEEEAEEEVTLHLAGGGLHSVVPELLSCNLTYTASVDENNE